MTVQRRSSDVNILSAVLSKAFDSIDIKKRLLYVIIYRSFIIEDIVTYLTPNGQKMELPPPDELDGWRTHAWVLVLSGPMGVEEPFFIEPAEGNAYPLDAPQYQQIDSVYNHENYYVSILRRQEHQKNI